MLVVVLMLPLLSSPGCGCCRALGLGAPSGGWDLHEQTLSALKDAEEFDVGVADWWSGQSRAACVRAEVCGSMRSARPARRRKMTLNSVFSMQLHRFPDEAPLLAAAAACASVVCVQARVLAGAHAGAYMSPPARPPRRRGLAR